MYGSTLKISFFFQAEDGIRDYKVTGVQTCALPILLAAGMHGGIDHLGDLQPLGQKADAPVDLAQALLAVEIVTVLGAVAIAGRPVHDLHDARALVVDQVQQLRLRSEEHTSELQSPCNLVCRLL